MWLANVTVFEPATGTSRPGCAVEVQPTGVVVDGWPEGAGADDVVDVLGSPLTLPAPGVPTIADALQAAVVAGDVAAADRLYADDIVIWHNYDGIERDKAEGLAAIAAIRDEYEQFDAVDVRRDYLADGYVQRTVFRGRTRAAQPFRADAMMRVWVDGRLITRIEEYSAPEQLPPG